MESFTVWQMGLPDNPKNTHIDHLEDIILDGPDATNHAIRLVKEFGQMLFGDPTAKLDLSTKWDGSPALVFGPDPADGRFFVATKSAFNKVPKLCKSHGDINALYPDGPLRTILHTAYDVLVSLHSGLILQGDVLFVNSPGGSETRIADLRCRLVGQTIDGHDVLTFTPNTLTYAIDPDSETGQRVAAAVMGLAVHTAYVCTGETLETCRAVNLSPEMFASLRQAGPAGERLFVVDANFDDVSGEVAFTDQESDDFDVALNNIPAAIDPAVYAQVESGALPKLVQRFFNYCVRQNRMPYRDDFLAYLMQCEWDASKDLKTDHGKQGVKDRYAALIAKVNDQRDGWGNFFALHRALARAKTLIIRALERAPAHFRTYVKDGDRLIPTGPEGYVAVWGDRPVKLVDRQEFSRRNFTVNENRS